VNGERNTDYEIRNTEYGIPITDNRSSTRQAPPFRHGAEQRSVYGGQRANGKAEQRQQRPLLACFCALAK
jgi:hypothetical protein